MKIDVATLFIVFMMNCVVVGSMFFAVWFRSRNPVQLRAGAAALILAVGIGLLLLRGEAPEWASLTLANTLILGALGLAWSAARTFEERPAAGWITFAGAAIWLILRATPLFDLPVHRIVFTSLVMAAYAWACGDEFSRPRAVALKMRRPMAVLLYVHAVLVAFRAVYVLYVPPANVFEADGLLGLLLAEPAVMVLALSLLGVGLVREHAEHALRHVASTDDLTGVLNRRALLAGAGSALAGTRQDAQPAALLLFDLDHFKSINDRFGHFVGDETLRAFARIASHAIRQSDVFGRFGGEEFAAFLPGADERTAHRIAERIRAEFSRMSLAPDWPSPTVSVGVAVAAANSEASLDALLVEADRALYEAKRGGRDRVVGALALAS